MGMVQSCKRKREKKKRKKSNEIKKDAGELEAKRRVRAGWLVRGAKGDSQEASGKRDVGAAHDCWGWGQ